MYAASFQNTPDSLVRTRLPLVQTKDAETDLSHRNFYFFWNILNSRHISNNIGSSIFIHDMRLHIKVGFKIE